MPSSLLTPAAKVGTRRLCVHPTRLPQSQSRQMTDGKEARFRTRGTSESTCSKTVTRSHPANPCSNGHRALVTWNEGRRPPRSAHARCALTSPEGQRPRFPHGRQHGLQGTGGRAGRLRCRNGRLVLSWVALSQKCRLPPGAPGLQLGAATWSSSSRTATTFERQGARRSRLRGKTDASLLVPVTHALRRLPAPGHHKTEPQSRLHGRRDGQVTL